MVVCVYDVMVVVGWSCVCVCVGVCCIGVDCVYVGIMMLVCVICVCCVVADNDVCVLV